MSEIDDGGLQGDFDLYAWIDQQMRIMLAEEVAKRWEEILFGPRLASMTDAMKKAAIGFEGITKAFEGFSYPSIWHVDEHLDQFTPAEFNKLWDGFSKERRIEYVLSLIS